jgi:hypothetical protein
MSASPAVAQTASRPCCQADDDARAHHARRWRSLFCNLFRTFSFIVFRLATQQLEQKAKSAEVIVRAVGLSRDTINTMTYIRNLQNGGFSDAIGVFNDKGHLVTHTDETIASALGKALTDPKLKLAEDRAARKASCKTCWLTGAPDR